MQKEWGRKRICYQCSSMFYDFNKREIRCPDCDANVNPEVMFKKKIKTVAPSTPFVLDEGLDSALDQFEEVEDVAGEDPESSLIGAIADEDEVGSISIED